MKIVWIVCAFVVPPAVIAQTATPYNLTVHVTGSQVGYDCGAGRGCEHTQILSVTIDGQHYELQADTLLAKGVVAIGDYPARIALDEHKPTNEFTRQYTIQFPDASTRTFDVIGQGEF